MKQSQLRQVVKEVIAEMTKAELDSVEKFADKELAPVDVEFTQHFLDRANDPRNGKEITTAELVGFFKRLAKNKKQFIEFIKKYQEIVAKDDKTNINMPFVAKVNQIIAKTVMRKDNFATSNPVYTAEVTSKKVEK